MSKEKKYPLTTVAIQNKVTECFRSMTIDEKRILILASPIARNNATTEKDQIFISAQDFATECGILAASTYKQLEVASKKLIDRSFSYVNSNGKKVRSNWVIDATYEDSGISLRFTSIVLEMLKILDSFNPYTKYKKEIVLKLKKDYSIDFYHLAKKNEKLGKFTLTIEQAFEELGLPDSYRDLSNFKRRALKAPIEEINACTDLTLDYFPIKSGRTVVGYEFSIKEKPKPKVIETGRDPNTIDLFFKMSDSQINTYGNQLARLSELSHLAVGNESYDALANRIKDMLKDEKKQKQFIPHLKNLGFVFR